MSFPTALRDGTSSFITGASRKSLVSAAAPGFTNTQAGGALAPQHRRRQAGAPPQAALTCPGPLSGVPFERPAALAHAPGDLFPSPLLHLLCAGPAYPRIVACRINFRSRQAHGGSASRKRFAWRPCREIM